MAEAAAEAQEVVIEIAAADRNSTWPFFAQRYLRPDLIISVDLVERERRQRPGFASGLAPDLTGEGVAPPTARAVGGSRQSPELEAPRLFESGSSPVSSR